MKKIFTAIAAAICICGSLKLAYAAEVEYKPLSGFGITAGERIPIAGLVDSDGNAITEECLLGKPVLINFYTKYCAPCIKEVPKLNRIMELRGDIHVLAITPDSNTEVAKYVNEYGLN